MDEAWAGEPVAHLGICVPKFPNLFFTYGPNTNIVINGSIIYFSELEVDWIVKALGHLVDTGATTLEATEEAIINSLTQARTVSGNGRTVPALPVDEVLRRLRQSPRG